MTTPTCPPCINHGACHALGHCLLRPTAREAIHALAAQIRAEDRDRPPLPPQEGPPSPFGPLHDLRLRNARREGER